MSKRVYISADYDEKRGDRDVVDVLHSWGEDAKHRVDFVDTAGVASGSVSKDPDCRACDLKSEFNRQINASSAVIIVVGDKTAGRVAGSVCERNEKSQCQSECTPFKQNASGRKECKIKNRKELDFDGDVCSVNSYSYLRHEFEQASKQNKNIIVTYNSLRREPGWLPSFLSDYEQDAEPFWVYNKAGERQGNYPFIKKALGYE